MTREFKIVTVYRMGSSDGYTHTFSGPLYRTYDAAKAAGIMQHGAYAVEPQARDAIDTGDGHGILLEGGPLQFAETAELDRKIREGALAKLTPYERKLLGVTE